MHTAKPRMLHFRLRLEAMGLLVLIAFVFSNVRLSADLSIFSIKAAPAPIHKRRHYSPHVEIKHHRLVQAPLPQPAQPPNAITVSSAVGSKFPTIASALASIKAGGIVTVEPGTYNESLTLPVDVTLQADPQAKSGSVVIESSNMPCLTIIGSSGKVTGITFQSTDSSQPNSVNVEILQGSPTLTNCNIGAAAIACIEIHGENTRTVLKDCTIHDGAQESLLIQDSASAIVDQSTITSTGTAAVKLDTLANASLTNCTLSNLSAMAKHEGGGYGFVATGESKGTLTSCTIGPTDDIGVRIDGASAFLKDCSAHDCGGIGFLISRAVYCTIEGCTVNGTQSNGIVIAGSNASLNNCTVQSCQQAGIMVGQKSSATISNLTVFNTSIAGVQLFSSASLQNASIHDITGHGVWCLEQDPIELSDLTISHVTDCGIDVQNNTKTTITGCTMRYIKGIGILLFSADGTTATGCNIDSCSGIGIVTTDGHCDLSHSVISNCKSAFSTSGSGSLHLTDCLLYNNASRLPDLDTAVALDQCEPFGNVPSPLVPDQFALASVTTLDAVAQLKQAITSGADVNYVDPYGATPLMIAAGSGNVDAINLLANNGAQLMARNRIGMCAFDYAAAANQLDSLRALLLLGTNVNEQDTSGTTALIRATEHNNLGAIQFLLSSGANPELGDFVSLETPLIKAVKDSSPDIVEYLLGHGSNVNEQDSNKNSALIFAVRAGRLDIIKILLDHGANVKTTNLDGETALTFANLSNRQDIASLLKQAGEID